METQFRSFGYEVLRLPDGRVDVRFLEINQAFERLTTIDRTTLLGRLRWNRYRLDGTNLLLERPLEDASAILARNVVAFRAQYGAAGVAAGSTSL